MKVIKKRYTFFIFILIFLLTFIYLNKNLFFSNNLKNKLDDISSSFGKEKNDFFDFDNIIPQNFTTFENDLAAVGSSEFIVFSQNFKKKLSVKHDFKHPILKCSRYKSLVFDTSGNKYMITSKSKVLSDGSVDKKIITGEISELDNFVLVTESDKYCCEMKVIDIKGNDKFQYFFANMYIIDVSINNDGDKIAICGMKSEEGVIKSVVQIFDIKSEFPIFTKELDDTFISINFFDNKNISIIGNHSTICIKNLGQKIKEFKYPKKQMCLFSFNKDFGTAISFSPSNDYRNQYILILNKNCQQTSKIETGKKLKSIFFKNKSLTILSENQVQVLDINGNNKLRSKSSTQCKSAIFLPNTKSIALASSNKITKNND